MYFNIINMKKLLFLLVLIISIANFFYTFGYQGESMIQFEFLFRTLVSIFFGVISIVQLIRIKNP
jgi:hypothetical protein